MVAERPGRPDGAAGSGCRSELAEVGTLDGVGHGTALGDRYRLEERLDSTPTWASWRAVDQILERPVTILVVTGPTAEDTLDAARRAAMVEDPRLLRILDVGSEPGPDGPTYVVSEHVDGRTLADVLLDEGPLPAGDVRALVGEMAQALERARQAGLHHRRIHPGAVLRTRDGEVKLSGLAVHAAAVGEEDEDDVTAGRQDAVSLVAVLYAGLTGRWPFGAVAGLEQAPLVSGRPTPPADLASGVPNDLDTLCAVTLAGHGDGPRTPGELAEQLAPWGGGTPKAASGRPPRRFPVALAGGAGIGSTAPMPVVPAEPALAESATGDPTAPLGPAGATNPTGLLRAEPAYTPQFAGRGGGAGAGGPRAGDAAGPDDGSRERPGLSFAEAIGTGEYADPPRNNPTQKIVLAVVAALVVTGLVLAVRTLSGVGGDDDAPTAAPTAATTTSPAPTTTPASPSPTATTPPAPAAQPAVAGITTLDPQGGDGENDDEVSDAIDDDTGSYWPSSTYTSADFGGLKDGVGVVVQLEQATPVSAVTLTLRGSGGAFELRTAPGAGLGGSQVVAEGTVTGEPVELALPEPVETQHLIVWFTELPETDAGYRVELADVQVR